MDVSTIYSALNIAGTLAGSSREVATTSKNGALADATGGPTLAGIIGNDGKKESIFKGQEGLFGGVGKIAGSVVGGIFCGPLGSMLGNSAGELAGKQASADTDAILNLFA